MPCPLTDQLGLSRREKHVDIVWVNNGSEFLTSVDQYGASHQELPSVKFEGRDIRVGAGGGILPRYVTIVGAWVDSKPVEGASIVGTLGTRRTESKAKGCGFQSRLMVENPPDDAHVEVIGRPARSQTKQARDPTAVHPRRLIRCKDWEEVTVG